MEAEEHRLLARTKELGKAFVGDSVVVLVSVLDLEQVDHVHKRRCNAQPLEHVECRQRLERGHVAAGGDYQIGLVKRRGAARPAPLGHALGKLGARLVHGQKGRCGLLAAEDRVHAVGRLIGALGHGERHVGIAGVVGVHHVRIVCLVEQQVNKTGVLVREAVMVLAPHMAREQNVQTGDRRAPRNLAHGGLKPLAVLVDHGVHHMDKRLVGTPHAMAAGEHIGLQKALALVLGELLDHAARGGQQIIVIGIGVAAALPLLAGHAVGILQTVGGRLVRAKDAKVVVELHHVGRVGAKDAGRLGGAPAVTALGHRHLVRMDVGQRKLAAHLAAVRIGVRTQAQIAFGHKGRDLGTNLALGRKQLRRLVRAQPAAQHAEVLVRVFGRGQRHLVRTPAALGLLTVDVLGAGPALGRTEHDHRVHGARLVTRLGTGLDIANLGKDLFQQVGKATVDRGVRFVVKAGHKEVRLIAHAAEELGEFLVRDAREDGGVRDLVAVEMENRQHDAVGLGVHELVGLPGRGKRARLGLAVAHHGHGQQAGVIENRAIGVRKRVAQLAALVNGARGLGRKVARNATGVRELAEEPLQTGLVIGDVGTDLAVGAVEQRLRGTRRTAVTRPHKEHGVLPVIGDQAVNVPEQKVHARCGAPVAHQAVLNIGAAEVARLARFLVNPICTHERIGAQVDLAYRKVVGAAPVFLYPLESLRGYRDVELFPRRSKNGLRHDSS